MYKWDVTKAAYKPSIDQWEVRFDTGVSLGWIQSSSEELANREGQNLIKTMNCLGPLEQIKEKLIEELASKGDKPFLASTLGSYTGPQLAEEIKNWTPKGQETVLNILLLTVDLIYRSKIA